MMDVSPTYLRFFAAACCFGIVIGVMGCATNNWSQPLFKNRPLRTESATSNKDAPTEYPEAVRAPKSFWKQGFGEMSGLDPRSREIERSLGF